MFTEKSAFRHDPGKAVLVLDRREHSVDWESEPAVCGYRRFSHETREDGAIPVPLCATPAVVTGVGVVIAGYDGRVSLFGRDLEKAYWTRQLSGPVYASLVVDGERRTVIAATTTGEVACLGVKGDLLWSTRLEVPVYATPTILAQAGVLVVAGFHSRCLGISLESGAVVFDRVLPEPWHATFGGSAAHRDPYASPATTEDGNVVLCCAEHVICLSASGDELWRHELGHSVRASPVAVPGTGEVVACAVNGECVFLDGRTGQRVAGLRLGAKIVASPAESEGLVVVGTEDGRVHAIDAARHEIAWTSAFGAPHDYTSFTLLPNGDFVATSAHGNVTALRRADGAFLWETSQLLGLPDHDPRLDITPMVGPDGSMYCGSYSGVGYHFRFRPAGPGQTGQTGQTGEPG